MRTPAKRGDMVTCLETRLEDQNLAGVIEEVPAIALCDEVVEMAPNASYLWPRIKLLVLCRDQVRWSSYMSYTGGVTGWWLMRPVPAAEVHALWRQV
jgi:hypothetical protein